MRIYSSCRWTVFSVFLALKGLRAAHHFNHEHTSLRSLVSTRQTASNMVKMLPAPHWLELTSVLVGVLIIGYSNGIYIDSGACKIGIMHTILEDSAAELNCLGTDDHMKWQMYFTNNTYTGWVTIANCTPSACTTFDENQYEATRRGNTSSLLKIMRADRKNVGSSIRCSNLLGDQLSSCKLRLYYDSPPSDCKVDVDRANKRANGSCVFNKFYRSDGKFNGCYVYEGNRSAFTVGQLVRSTFVDPVNGREYQNGTCYFAANLTRGYGVYIYRVLFPEWDEYSYPPSYTLDFAPDKTTTQTPDPTRVTELGTPVQPIGKTTTVIPSGPEKTSTQPASGGGTDPGNSTQDSGHKFTVLYALVGVGTVLIILTIIFVFLCKARIVQLVKGAAKPSNSVTTSEDVQANRPPQGREGSQYSDTLYATIQDDAPSSSTARPDVDGYLIPVYEPSNNVSDDAPSSSTARPDDDGYLTPVYGPSNNVSDEQDGVPRSSSTARPINADHPYLALVNELSIGGSVSPSGYTIPSRVR